MRCWQLFLHNPLEADPKIQKCYLEQGVAEDLCCILRIYKITSHARLLNKRVPARTLPAQTVRSSHFDVQSRNSQPFGATPLPLFGLSYMSGRGLKLILLSHVAKPGGNSGLFSPGGLSGSKPGGPRAIR